MDFMNITLDITELFRSKTVQKEMKKLLLVIESMSKISHIDATRKYIDLWYKSFGTKNKNIIEMYYKSRINQIKM